MSTATTTTSGWEHKEVGIIQTYKLCGGACGVESQTLEEGRVLLHWCGYLGGGSGGRGVMKLVPQILGKLPTGFSCSYRKVWLLPGEETLLGNPHRNRKKGRQQDKNVK